MKRLFIASMLLALAACNQHQAPTYNAADNLTETIPANECPRTDGQPCK